MHKVSLEGKKTKQRKSLTKLHKLIMNTNAEIERKFSTLGSIPFHALTASRKRNKQHKCDSDKRKKSEVYLTVIHRIKHELSDTARSCSQMKRLHTMNAIKIEELSVVRAHQFNLFRLC